MPTTEDRVFQNQDLGNLRRAGVDLDNPRFRQEYFLLRAYFKDMVGNGALPMATILGFCLKYGPRDKTDYAEPKKDKPTATTAA